MEKEQKKLRAFISAPLPFQGQKRRHVKEFSNIIKILQPEIVVDLFGGSGLLSHLAKRASPKSRVIYNDYDNYRERLENIGKTNELLRYFRELLKDFPTDSRLDGAIRETILKKLKTENTKGYVDWITLSSSLMFSMKYATNYADFEKNSFYNCIRMSDYIADGYLDGLEVVRADYSELCRQYRNTPGVLFIADPPYLSTDVKTYNSVEYWTLKDYLNVLTALSGLNFIYFTSEKSQIIELCEWLDSNEGKVRNIFKDVHVSTVKSNTSGKNSYIDIMLYKLNAV
ncbi:MAG: DNA adenine methylase [Bacteroidetes bacterium]|nr:DNA adenine methylase [Bacteroidota bacterium]